MIIFFKDDKEVNKNRKPLSSNETQVNLTKSNSLLKKSIRKNKNNQSSRNIQYKPKGKFVKKRVRSDTWLSSYQNDENDFLKRRRVKLIKGIFASHRLIKSKRFIRKSRGFYFYETESETEENVFFDDINKKANIWTGEVSVVADNKSFDVLERMSDVTILKRIGETVIFKIRKTSDVFDKLELIESQDGFDSLNLDFKVQRMTKF